MPLISKLLFSLFILTQVAACALFEERGGPPTSFAPREQVFYASFDEVWQSVNLVLQPYPLRISNMDQGMIETDAIRGYRIWVPPYKSDTAASGETYRLVVRVIKGKPIDSRPATKITIVKEAQLQIDFFSDPRTIPSDGLEEKAILYRIGREIQIARTLARSQKKKPSKKN